LLEAEQGLDQQQHLVVAAELAVFALLSRPQVAAEALRPLWRLLLVLITRLLLVVAVPLMQTVVIQFLLLSLQLVVAEQGAVQV